MSDLSAIKCWFTITCKNKEGTNEPDPSQPVEIGIYDDIGAWGVTARDFIASVQPYKNSELHVNISSLGGSVFEGLAIYNYLRGLPNVSTHVIGVAASMASVVALAGKTVSIADNGYFMVHNPSGGVYLGGTADEMHDELGRASDYIDLLRKLQGNLQNTYSRETGAAPDLVQRWMDGETWFSAQEAKDAGLADTITEGAAFSACVDRFSNPPLNIGSRVFRAAARIDCAPPSRIAEIDKPTTMSTSTAPTPTEKSFADNLRAFLGLGTTQPVAEAPELVAVRADLVTAKATITSLGGQVTALTAEVSTLKASLETAKTDLATAKSEAEAARKEVEQKASQQAAAITASQGQPALNVKPNDNPAATVKGKTLTEQCLEAKAKLAAGVK